MSYSLAERDVNLRKMVVVRKKEEKKFLGSPFLSTLGWVFGTKSVEGEGNAQLHSFRRHGLQSSTLQFQFKL